MAISYTQATGKRPSLDPETLAWRWYVSASGQYDHEPDVVPAAIYVRMDYQSHHDIYEAALAAADAAYERAVADGAMGPIELANRPDAG